jgi:hypothetical protein
MVRTIDVPATSSTENVLATARAFLKHAPTPSEARTNLSALDVDSRTRRTGVATVNVPSDKMAAFLKEMKNVRLRKVNGGVGVGPPQMSMPSHDARRTNEENVGAGKKRKWQAFADLDSYGQTGKEGRGKVHEVSSCSPGNALASRRLDELFAKRPPMSPLPSDSPQRPRPPARPISRANLPPPPTFVIDDSDEDERSLSNASPPPSTAFLSPEPESRDQSHVGSRETSVLSERPSGTKMSRNVSRASMVSTSKARARGRQTLDRELREALTDPSDLEDEVYVGVGTKSKKRGFLARGGAGGAPVFMGVGYIEGVEDEPIVEEWQPQLKGRRRRGCKKGAFRPARVDL